MNDQQQPASTTDLDQLEAFLDDLATPYLRYIQAKVNLAALSHENQPVSLTRWANAIDRARAQMYATRDLILTYADSVLSAPGFEGYEPTTAEEAAAPAGSLAFAPES